MQFTHLRPGNIVRWNGQHWVVIEAHPKTLEVVSFSSSTDRRRLNSRTTPPPIMEAENPADFVINLVSCNY